MTIFYCQYNGHFVAVSINWTPERTVTVFDSLCIAFQDRNLTGFLTRFLKDNPGFQVKSSPFIIQDPTSHLCSVHCLAFLASQSLKYGEPFQNFYRRFQRDDLLKNDQVSLNYVLRFITICSQQ